MSNAQMITSKEEFDSKVLGTDKPVLVDFFASWCGPCKMVAPELEALADNLANEALIVKVDVEKQPQIASEYHVAGVPTLVFFKDGREVNRMVGFRPRDVLSAAVKQIM